MRLELAAPGRAKMVLRAPQHSLPAVSTATRWGLLSLTRPRAGCPRRRLTGARAGGVPAFCARAPRPCPERSSRKAAHTRGQCRAGWRLHVQAGHGRPRQDPRARKLSLSQRGQHVGADGLGGGRRTPESLGEPLTVPAARHLGPGL